MRPGNAAILKNQHPLLFGRSDQVPSRFALDGFAVGDGWFAILDDMATSIERACAEKDVKHPQVLQIKEKMGLLRVYLGPSDQDLLDILALAEERSATVCEACGEPGSLRRGRWLRTSCDRHADE